MSASYAGILGWLAEACDIQRELGCSAGEAHMVQEQRAAERLREQELEKTESNVIPFRSRARNV